MSLLVDKAVKDNGRIYTPIQIVKMMLDYCGYISNTYIQKKHVIDPSCGDGQILSEVVKRYIESYMTIDGLGFNIYKIQTELKEYIHGIEIDEIECKKCIDNLNNILKTYHISPIDWDIKCGNSLTFSDFDKNMDYVIGNPPYVRMKNIKKSNDLNDDYIILKSYTFSSKGMSDLYLAFYEYGLRLLNDNGVLCYIAPSAWINSSSGENMRKYIRETHYLNSVIDFEHTQVFNGAQTYVMITLFDKRPHSFIRYDKYSFESNYFYPVMTISYDDAFISDKLYFTSKSGYEILKSVECEYEKKAIVKNGYATLADDIFIDDCEDFKHFTIPVLKCSTGKWKKCLFPYDNNMNLIPLEKIKSVDEDVYNYFMKNKERLQNRTYDGKDNGNNWHCIGRSQGLNDTYRDKIAINCIVKQPSDLKMVKIKSGEGVYGGLYILTDQPFDEISNILKSWEFIEYVKTLRKYKSGGYYTFSSKDVENYLNFKLNKKSEE